MNPAADAGRSFEQWQSALHSACGHYETRMAHQGGLFIGEITEKQQAGLELAWIRTNAGLISKKHKPDWEDDTECFLVSQRSGYTRIEQQGQTLNLVPGDVFIMDSAYACNIVPLGLIEHVSISLPRDRVLGLLGQRPLFGKVSATCVSGAALRLIINQLYHQEQTGKASMQEAEAMITAFCSLLGSSLQCSGDVMQPELAASGLLEQVHSIIDACLTHSNLTPVMVAQHAGISVRHLYRLFEDRGDSVCRYIQRSRLQHSADDLANLSGQNESITAIAYKWGFTDSAHFSRSFKKQFNLSPREYRKQALN